MAEATAIEWADSTFNPWIGCTKISPACDNCYAAVSRPAVALSVKWGAGAPRRQTSESTWRQPAKWDREHEAFFAAHGRRRRVFCASLADVFDNEVPDWWRREMFNLIRSTPNLDWLLLTKRISNAWPLIVRAGFGPAWPLPNVWLGATICNQKEADRDIPHLLSIPARKHFISFEPLLEPITYYGAIYDEDGERALDWVIVGGESGKHARPMHPDWVRALRDDFTKSDTPFFFKQWGEWLPISEADEALLSSLHASRRKARRGEDQGAIDDMHGMKCIVDQLVIHRDGAIHDVQSDAAFNAGAGGTMTLRVGKRKAGRMLDGRTWEEVPTDHD